MGELLFRQSRNTISRLEFPANVAKPVGEPFAQLAAASRRRDATSHNGSQGSGCQLLGSTALDGFPNRCANHGNADILERGRRSHALQLF
jgi:hypothetical protein